jgi:hypothetical protein
VLVNVWSPAASCKASVTSEATSLHTSFLHETCLPAKKYANHDFSGRLSRNLERMPMQNPVTELLREMVEMENWLRDGDTERTEQVYRRLPASALTAVLRRRRLQRSARRPISGDARRAMVPSS